MPVLHTYRSKEGHYILAGVNGRIVTYRLSVDGARRLQNDSITDGDTNIKAKVRRITGSKPVLMVGQISMPVDKPQLIACHDRSSGIFVNNQVVWNKILEEYDGFSIQR